MSGTRQTLVRGCALLLLALAISPLTAPFSAGHPLDLFGGASHVQTKKAPDEPLVSLPALTPTFAAAQVVSPATHVLPASHASVRPQLDIPLRL